MTFRYANRKRPRTNEELDFMPISKKMSDLHIRSNHTSSQGLENNGPNAIVQCNSLSVLESQQNNCCSDTKVVVENIYAPELNSTQNPYYYRINSILYEAHLLRLQRLSKLENSNAKIN